MSDQKPHVDALLAQLEEDKKKEARKEALQEQKLILEEARTRQALEKHLQTERELQAAKGISFTVPTNDYLVQLQQEIDDYLIAAKNPMTFMFPSTKDYQGFDKMVPWFRKNLIFIGAKTGEGKSTAIANIILGTISHPDPITGRPRRVLVLTNEEKAEDVYNRVTCLIKGWAYVNHNQFTDEQRKIFKEYMAKLMALGLVVVDNGYGGVPGNTTTIEGVRNVFERIHADPIKFDAILIDYYQNVRSSKLNPRMNQFEVQEEFANLCDRYKNLYPAPILVVGQVKPPDAQDTPFEVRVKGSKEISVKATVTIEMMADRKMRRTAWHCHKGRFTESVGQSFFTGYDKGRFVPYTPEFQTKALQLKEKQEANKWNKKSAEDLAAKMSKEVENKNAKDQETKKLEEAGQKGEEIKK